MTSISPALEIINADLDLERNVRMRQFTYESQLSFTRSVPPKMEKFNIRNSVDELPKPEDREHVQIFEKILNLVATYAKFVGVDLIYEWIPLKSIALWFAIFNIWYTWASVLNTQRMHLNDGEVLRSLEPCALYGIASSCAQKVFGYIKKRYQILSLFFAIRKICRQTVGGKHAEILKSDLLKTFKILKMYTVGVVMGVSLYVVGPAKSYFVDGILISLSPVEMLFIDSSTPLGFGVMNVVMAILGLFAALGTILYGALLIFAILMYSAQINLIGQDFKDLDDMWATNSSVSLAYKRSFLKNICNKCQDIKDFMSTIKDIYESKLFYYFCFNYFSQIICLFEITKNDWVPGYGIASLLFIEMMFYCVMGSQITIADDKLCAIINDTNWYGYDLSSQKIVLLLLHRSQQTDELQLGFIGPLTMVTGIEIVKSIYSYYTVLTELF